MRKSGLVLSIKLLRELSFFSPRPPPQKPNPMNFKTKFSLAATVLHVLDFWSAQFEILESKLQRKSLGALLSTVSAVKKKKEAKFSL